jgi:hypothetical protein
VLSLTIVRVASLLVPRGVRGEWTQEWEAEIGYRAEKLRSWGRWSAAGRLQLTARSLGAVADAAWLRMDDLRQGIFADCSASTLRSPRSQWRRSPPASP